MGVQAATLTDEDNDCLIGTPTITLRKGKGGAEMCEDEDLKTGNATTTCTALFGTDADDLRDNENTVDADLDILVGVLGPVGTKTRDVGAKRHANCMLTKFKKMAGGRLNNQPSGFEQFGTLFHTHRPCL